MNVEYLHSFSTREQKRLYAQARVLEQGVFENVNFMPGSRILEVGCGVGAQSEILLERFPSTEIVSIDHSSKQIHMAQSYFKTHRFYKRIQFLEGDANQLPLEACQFDGAFICWVLEHLPDPLKALTEVRRCLKPGAVLHINEVFNQLMFVSPHSEAVQEYWAAFNQLQIEMGGDPYMGARLGYLLNAVGFRQIQLSLSSEHWDVRECRQRRWMTQYWSKLLQSAEAQLLERGKITPILATQVKKDLKQVAEDPTGVLFFAWVKARAMA